MKTIVPATANLKVALRLVPDQLPTKLWPRSANGSPSGYRNTQTSRRYHPWAGGAAGYPRPNQPAVRILCEAIEQVWGKQPLFTRSGGSGPEEGLGRLFGAPVICLGIGLPEDNYHAPNERLELDQLWKGIVAAGELYLGLQAVKDELKVGVPRRTPTEKRKTRKAEAVALTPADAHEWVSFEDPGGTADMAI